jgi:hypothetical protein
MDMRTTLDLDDDLLERARQRFPAGTPKTVIIEESLRQSLARTGVAPGSAEGLPPELGPLVARGILVPARWTGVPPQSTGPPLPQGVLASDLASDRQDR